MTDDSPYSRGYRDLLEAMYKNNSARVDIAGTVESVSQITAEMLNKCYDTFYNPNNMALVVCGDVTPKQVLEIADRVLPDTFVGKEVERSYCDNEPQEVFEKLREVRMEVSKPIFTIGVKDCDINPDPNERMRKFTAMALICELLFSRSGELYNELFESGKITPDFGGIYTSSKTFAHTVISGEADEPREILEYIKNYIANYTCTEEALNRCKRVLYAEFVMDFDSTEEIANNLIDYVFEGFDLFEYGRVIESISADEINRLLKTEFKEEYFAMSVVYPLDA
jgi:predicted Zn-dependent peptidase